MNKSKSEPAAPGPSCDRRRKLSIKMRSIGELKPNPRNARTHSKKQVKQIASSIKRFGFTSPLLTAGGEILAGHGRLEASKRHCQTNGAGYAAEAVIARELAGSFLDAL